MTYKTATNKQGTQNDIKNAVVYTNWYRQNG